MKLIKLDRRYHGFSKWSHALEFTKYECHIRHRKHAPYVKAFREIYGEDSMLNPDWSIGKGVPYMLYNHNWRYDPVRRRIYFKDPSVLTFVELKIA